MKEDKFYKWIKNDDVFCARVIGENTAHYYKNGEVYALYQTWIPQPTDIEITEDEFNSILKLNKS